MERMDGERDVEADNAIEKDGSGEKNIGSGARRRRVGGLYMVNTRRERWW